MDWSVSKLIRIEAGTVGISTNDLRVLLQYYQVDPQRIDEVVQMARAAKQVSPWAPWRNDASPEYLTYLGYEAAAAITRNFEPTFVPGLLQTEDYTRAVLLTMPTPEKLEPLVDLRMFRQELLTRPSPPKLHFILDESVVRRQVGSAEIMRAQVQRLLDLASAPHITIRIIPLRHGMYPQMRIPYVLFEFEEDEDEDEDVLYVENPLGEMIKDDPREEHESLTALKYLSHFWEMEQIAPREATEDLLKSALESFT